MLHAGRLQAEAQEEKAEKSKRMIPVYLLLFLLLFLTITFAVIIGPVSIHPLTVWKIIANQLPFSSAVFEADWSRPQERIIWDIRLPRVLLGGIVGAGLATVGVGIQALVRNSLADPYILGVSSGASVGATVVILLGAFSMFGQYALSFAAFSGALLSIIFVYFIAHVGGRLTTTRLLLAGVVVSMILSAVTSFIVISAPNEQGIRSAMFWMMGSLAGAKWSYLMIPSIAVVLGSTYLMTQFRSLNLLLMGEETAGTLGVDVNTFRKKLIIVTALLTGVIVAISGAIGFVGLMIPHLVRLVVGADHRKVLPISALAGAIFIIWADVFARIVVAPSELPIGIITALCGGPFFIWLLRKSEYSFGGGDS